MSIDLIKIGNVVKNTRGNGEIWYMHSKGNVILLPDGSIRMQTPTGEKFGIAFEDIQTKYNQTTAEDLVDYWMENYFFFQDDPLFNDDKGMFGRESPLRSGFGRIKTSQSKGLWTGKLLHDKGPLYWSEELGGAADSVFINNEACVDMSVSGNGDYAIRQTRQRFNYQSGNDQDIKVTGTLGDPTPDTLARAGYYNSNTVAPFNSNLDGMCFERDDIGVACVIYKNGVITHRCYQEDWNVDVGDDIDWTKSQVFMFEFEWLGVGGAAFGIYIGRNVRLLHIYDHANVGDGVYMSTPNHSIRYEIRSTGGASSLKVICNSVKAEGGEDVLGLPISISTKADHLLATNIGVIYPMLGVRLKSTHLDQVIQLANISSVSETNDDYRLLILFNPNYSGGVPSWSDRANSSCQSFSVSGTPTITIVEDAWELDMTEIYTHSTQSIGRPAESTIRMGSHIDGDVDEIVIAVQTLSVNAQINGSLNWVEL
jgi:hypothetical protein